jgi:branched-chain amino acid aminotransferase
MKISRLNLDEAVDKYFNKRDILAYQNNYLAFYSSYLGGIVTDPRALLIPLDDHMAHRGDAVFEAFKATQRKIHLLDAHLDRLFRSADNISLKVPNTKDEIKAIAVETARAAKNDDLMFRLFVSRGPGGFAANPYEPKQSQLYMVALKSVPIDESKFQNGIKCGWSAIPQKEKCWAVTKSCNYLPNVMMKKESVDRGLEFTISLDENDSVAESSTENIVIIDKQGRLRIPRLTHILSGTMMLRLFELVKSKLADYKITDCLQGLISKEELFGAKEVMIVSTTYDTLGVTHFEGQAIADGKVGEQTKRFRQLLVEDQLQGALITPF